RVRSSGRRGRRAGRTVSSSWPPLRAGSPWAERTAGRERLPGRDRTRGRRGPLRCGAEVSWFSFPGFHGCRVGKYKTAMEERFLYFPTRDLAAEPADYGLTGEALAFETEDGVRLHGWHVRGSGARGLLFFHGNAGNIGD